MFIWKFETPKQFFASCLWNLSELFNVGLGRFAPTVFHAMLNYKAEKWNA